RRLALDRLGVAHFPFLRPLFPFAFSSSETEPTDPGPSRRRRLRGTHCRCLVAGRPIIISAGFPFQLDGSGRVHWGRRNLAKRFLQKASGDVARSDERSALRRGRGDMSTQPHTHEKKDVDVASMFLAALILFLAGVLISFAMVGVM